MEAQKKVRGRPFEKGNKGKPKGASMNLTKQMRTVKETVLNVFNELQSDAEHNLTAFAKANPRDFYNIAAKLIPTEITGSLNGEITVRSFTLTKSSARDK